MLGCNRLRKGYAFPVIFPRAILTKAGYDVANQTAYLDDMLRWGLNWLIKVSSD